MISRPAPREADVTGQGCQPGLPLRATEATTTDQCLGRGVRGTRWHLTPPPSSPRGSPPTGSLRRGLGPGSYGSAPSAPRARPRPPHLREAPGERQVVESLGPGDPGVPGAPGAPAGPRRPGLPLPWCLPSSWPGIPKG